MWIFWFRGWWTQIYKLTSVDFSSSQCKDYCIRLKESDQRIRGVFYSEGSIGNTCGCDTDVVQSVENKGSYQYCFILGKGKNTISYSEKKWKKSEKLLFGQGILPAQIENSREIIHNELYTKMFCTTNFSRSLLLLCKFWRMSSGFLKFQWNQNMIWSTCSYNFNQRRI